MSTPQEVGTQVGTEARAQAQESPRPRRRKAAETAPESAGGGTAGRAVEVAAPERAEAGGAGAAAAGRVSAEVDSAAGVAEEGAAAEGAEHGADSGGAAASGARGAVASSKGSSAPPDVAAIAPSLEAILLSTDRAVPAARLAEVLGATFPAITTAGLKQVVEHLNEAYSRDGRSFRIEPVSGGLRIMTLPQYADVLARFHGQRAQTRLSRPAIETLAIIAYKQPITRAEIEAIRGVASGEILKTLMERRLVTIAGRAEELGRPMLYATTRQFLEVFGLASLKDLPPPEEFGLKT